MRPERAAGSTFQAHLGARAAGSFLSSAWAAVVGEPPTAQTKAILTAHWAVETDSGRGMPGHNFAGIKAAAGAPGAVFRTVEGHGATRHEVAARFRVYGSPEAGAHDYVQLLVSRYPAAVAAARAGDAAGFAKALADGGYFTADPRAYAAALSHRLTALTGNPQAAPAAAPAQQWAIEGLLRAFHSPEADP